jgi:hypothetical protein
MMLSSKTNIFANDTFYLTYDEPNKLARFKAIQELIPNIKHIDGIKGFDKAHKACARESQTDRLVIIDGDNSLIMSPEKLNISKELIKSNYVLSYSSVNSINGLIYGNGGVKSWPRDLLLNLKSHEESQSEKDAVDFCFTVPYYQIALTPTLSNINITPKQAFRAGYREGIKMCLDKGLPIQYLKGSTQLDEIIVKGNFFRLKTWCELGQDALNGIWGIFGARKGALDLLAKCHQFENIRDYDWFEKEWCEKYQHLDPLQHSINCGKELRDNFNLHFEDISSDHSRRLKKDLCNPRREGPMYCD